jgi:hypothetical protein
MSFRVGFVVRAIRHYRSTYKPEPRGFMPATAPEIDLRLPLMEEVKSTWPLPRPSEEAVKKIIPRTISDDVLRFEMSATFDKGFAIFYPHIKIHPADLKVRLFVSLTFRSLFSVLFP